MKLSIIIPTIGRETLWPVLESIKNQHKYSAQSHEIPTEVLIIFDGKAFPKFKKNSEKFSDKKNLSFHFLETQKKSYASGARNLGLQKSTGTHIAFLGDDTIIQENWFTHIYNFFTPPNNQQKNILLGYIDWPKKLKQDPFHRFLLNGPQFNFPRLKKYQHKRIPDQIAWKFFYTANIILKKPQKTYFSSKFQGWGFEDIEFGYQLIKSQKYQVHYNPDLKVEHHDPQTLKSLIQRTQMAQKNAKTFETLHPEIKIHPNPIKQIILKILISLAALFPRKRFPQIHWWKEWKKAWITEKNI